MKICLLLIAFVFSSSVFSQSISGTIKDASGFPVPDAFLVDMKTNKTALSDFDGKFTIESKEGAEIQISVGGFATKIVTAAANMTVVLSPVAATELESVVVIGYGTKKRRTITGSIVQIKSEEIIKNPAQSAIQSIQGKAAGVNIVTNDEPGSNPTIQIRGMGTIVGGRTPLYVIDGVEAGSINNLSPNEIATMDILKDASSLAIYGQKGANGVIIITTKKGKIGEVKVSYDSYFGVKQIQRKIDMADSFLYGYYNNVALGSATYFNSNQPYNTDWLEEITTLGQVASNFVSLSGGSETAKYYIGYTNYTEKGILMGADFNRNNINSRTEFKVWGNRLKVSQNVNIAITRSTQKPLSAFTNAYKQSPLVPVKFENGRWGVPLRNPNTGLADINGSDRFNNVGNPAAQLFYTNQQNRNLSLLGSVMAELKLHKDLKFTSSFGATYDVESGFTYVPIANIFLSQNPTSNLGDYEDTFGSKPPQYNSLSQRRRNSYAWNWDNYMTYTKRFNDHSVTILGGMSRTTRGISDNLSGTRFNVPVQSNYWSLDLSTYNEAIEPGQVVQNIQSTPVVSLAYFARAEYDYQGKYLFSAVVRREGISVFQTAKKWAVFPAVSAGWIVSDESFFENIKTIDYLKFRAGYGEVGNGNTGNNTNTVIFRPNANYTFGPGQGIYPGSMVPYQVDPNLTWETMREFDFGFDFSLFKKRLTGTVEYYNRQSVDLILPIDVPRVLSSQRVFVNTGEVSNVGQELTLRWSDQITDHFSYYVGGNISNNKNSLDKVNSDFFADFVGGGLNNGEFTKQVRVGEPLGSFYVYEVTGFNSDGGFTYSDERVNAGSYIPTYTYGMSFGGNYRQFDFSVDTYGVGGNKIFNGKKAQRFGGENVEVSVLDNFWLPNNPNASNPKPSNNVPRPSTYFIEDGSFLRINNITVGYTFKKFYEKIDKVRLFVTALNPVIFTKYSGFSPEVSGGNNGDPLGGAGIELDAYPTNRTFLIGLNASF
jgi:TonB-linked SusC/RagA family outer membrane protein